MVVGLARTDAASVVVTIVMDTGYLTPQAIYVLYRHHLPITADSGIFSSKKEAGIKKSHVIGQYGLYLARNGSEPISPIPITIPRMQILSFVILNADIHCVLVWQLLLLFSAFSFRN
ncbi:MAG TPA: hypothetical protein VFZ67_07650 [Nitrososphaera sp.]